jgi:hypothetical protein
MLGLSNTTQYRGKIKRYPRTVKHTFSFVFAALIFAGFASVISQNESYIAIETSTENVVQEQQFVVDVTAFAHVPINAVDVVLSYPEHVMVVDSIDTGMSVISLWTEQPYAKDGQIYLRGGTFRKGFLGEHTIARIRAHAKAPGEARIVIQDTQLIAGDGNGTIVTPSESSYQSVKIAVEGSDGLLKAKADISVVTDVDGDGDVDFTDVRDFMAAWLTRASVYDFDKDGRMTFRDFSILLAESFFN